MNTEEVDTKTLKDIFDIILGTRVHSSQLSTYIRENFGEKLTHAEMIAIGQVLKASNERDTQAAIYIRDTMGQKPTDKKEIMGSKDNPFVVQLDGDLAELSE